ncbi:MAG TPA: excinuclease ABC subunit UvrC [Polyangia bacterium]|jgi:excinuclease ABC subunit C|nr:excinuclease ABC subunit UvrC [Polyangia bacterium]
MSEEAPKDDALAAPEPPALSLRESEVAPKRKPLAEILEGLPQAPGVYIMRDHRGKPVYIGKAAVLRNRVRQYFQPASGDSRDFVPLLEGIVVDIETVITSNEKEALLLENTLIKKHQPRFNVNLKDDKNYLVLRLDPAAEWPRLEVVRKLGDDGAFYFGPYHSATSCREALRVVNRHFQLRTCTDHVLHNRRRPCLQYQIKRCPAPCVLPVAPETYADQVRDVGLFLDGKSDELMDRLRARMKEAAARTDFEVAADVRDQVRALEVTLEEQRVVSADFCDQDVIGFHREGIALEIVVMSIRGGKLGGNRAFSFTGQEFPDAELLSSFIGLYYDLGAPPPDEVLLPVEIEDAALKAEWLGEKKAASAIGARRRKVEVLVPQRGDRRRLVELALKNAASSFATRRNARADTEMALGKLQKRLKLPKLPRVIECYDVSHIQGFATVASMVVFVDGKPEKSRYRTYKVRAPGRGGGAFRSRNDDFAAQNDDFASMYEVLSRRFRRAREESAAGQPEGPWALPDLIVIDGGKGQLGMALAAARDVGIDVRPGVGLSIVGLAKERDSLEGGGIEPEALGATTPEAPADVAPPVEAPPLVETEAQPLEAAPTEPPAPTTEPPTDETTGETTKSGRKVRAKKPTKAETVKMPDRVFLAHAKDAILIRPNSAEMFILQHLRDEAHRFAVTFHRSQRKRLTLRSALAEIPGIGEGRQRLLLRHFGSVKKIREASLEDLAGVPGMTRVAAVAVFEHWQRQPAPLPEDPALTSQVARDSGSAADPSGDAAEEDAMDSAFAQLEADDSAEESADGTATLPQSGE